MANTIYKGYDLTEMPGVGVLITKLEMREGFTVPIMRHCHRADSFIAAQIWIDAQDA